MNKKLLLPLITALVLISVHSYSQSPDYQIFGPHDENGKSFIVKVYYNYIVAPPPSDSMDYIG